MAPTQESLDTKEHEAAQPDAIPLIYGLEDKPAAHRATFAAITHLLAIVASIATAPLLIAQALALGPADTSYVIGAALMASGIATFIQVYRIGPIGSGLLSIQGTSFAFIGVFAYAGGILAARGVQGLEMVGVLLGSVVVGALLTVVAGAFIQRLSTWLTLNVTGVVIFLLGLSLMQAAAKNLELTLANHQSDFAVWLQAGGVVITIIACATRTHPWLRLISIPLGLGVGLLIALFTGDLVPPEALPGGTLLPRLMPFPLGFDLGICLLMLPIFLVTVTESVGDLTATAMISKQPLNGQIYWDRIRGGVMADGLNTILAAGVGTFPNTTFSQNNGVIQVTGVASRFVGYLVALGLVLLGAIPAFGFLFTLIPGGVLHATTAVLFTMIALAGLRILRVQADRANVVRMLVVCTAGAYALTWAPDLTAAMAFHLPDYVKLVMGFPVATGALLAIAWEGVRNHGH